MEPRRTVPRIKPTKEAIAAAANDDGQRESRYELAKYSSEQLARAGIELQLIGQIVGPDRAQDRSPFGHANDETVAISVLLRIASQLISSSAGLFAAGHLYAAAALIRQLVEIEYLAWAFETRDRDGERWLRSNQEQRQKFFKPAKLREAAKGKFRGKDYGYHCELGGHPVPQANILLDGDPAISQLLLSDMLGHVGRIWDHLVGWAMKNDNGEPILKRGRETSVRFNEWKARDLLVDLPPPE